MCLWLRRRYIHRLDLIAFGWYGIQILVIINGPYRWEINGDYTWLKENKESISFKSDVRNAVTI